MHSLDEKNEYRLIAREEDAEFFCANLGTVLSAHGHLGVATDNKTPDVAAGGWAS